MILFGRSKNNLEVLSADFLPFEKQLHLVFADADMNLQILQFDPESKRAVPTTTLTHTHVLCRSQDHGRPPSPPQIYLPHWPLSFDNAPPPVPPPHAE
jgi:hypothetical protein